MNERRFYFGLITTVVWLATMAALLYLSETPANRMKPNEWGDFFAGVFAPLAFLWLVLGYLQQGEELRLSSKALHLQAEELKNSVQQQRELVEVTRQQVDGEREALSYERRHREEEARPSFNVAGGRCTASGNGHCNYSFLLTNTGNTATALLVHVVPVSEAPRLLLNAPLFERGKQHGLNFEAPAPLEGATTQLQLSFIDVLGKQHQSAYAMQRETEHPSSPISFTRVEA